MWQGTRWGQAVLPMGPASWPRGWLLEGMFLLLFTYFVPASTILHYMWNHLKSKHKMSFHAWFYAFHGWLLMPKRVLRAINKLPHTKPLLVLRKECEIIGDWHVLLFKTWTSIKITLILIFMPMIFLVAKIKSWVVDKWNNCDQISYLFSSQNSLEFLIRFFRENMIHVYPHVSSPCHSNGV
jgi:hypothetical protein